MGTTAPGRHPDERLVTLRNGRSLSPALRSVLHLTSDLCTLAAPTKGDAVVRRAAADTIVEVEVTRRRKKNEHPRVGTLIPSFDPEDLRKEIGSEPRQRSGVNVPFDPASYARIVEGRVSAVNEPEPPGVVAVADALPPYSGDTRPTIRHAKPPVETGDVDEVGREMYSSYLTSDFPGALGLAERLLERLPGHTLARLVADRCRERLGPNARPIRPSSVLRLRIAELERQARHIDSTSSFVLGHIDGVSDAATIAALTGLPHDQALDRLHALVDLGILEVVNA